jgi:repressor LexA
MMMARKTKGLSERHKKILDFITIYQEENGYPPSIREIGKKTSISSTSVVNYYLDQLQNMGLIKRERHISRGVRLKSNLVNLVKIPIMGPVAAGTPIQIPASDFNPYSADESVEIARSILPVREAKDVFALKVKGDSMIDAMVNDGDIVIMKATQDAKNGDMVAVWLPDKEETTLKYFYKEKDGYRLQPANPTMNPIYIKKSEKLEIKGKVIMVIRQVATTAM